MARKFSELRSKMDPARRARVDARVRTAAYPITFEVEPSGTVSAYVVGLPVYASADTRAQAEHAIRGILTAYFEAHPEKKPAK